MARLPGGGKLDRYRSEYELTEITPAQLAKKYDLNYGSLKNRISAQGWKKQFLAEEASKRIEAEIVKDIAPTIKADIIDFTTSKAATRKKLLIKLNYMLDNEDKYKQETYMKVIESLAKYCGLYQEDNQQRNPLADLSKEARQKLIKDQLANIGFMT